MTPERLYSADDVDWLALRSALWPDDTAQEHLAQMRHFVQEPRRYAQFIVRDADARGLGLAEASIRTDHVNGTQSSPVAFLEGLYVRPEARRQGIARALAQAVAAWARALGCSELASDTGLENTISQSVHGRLGFTETERVVYFRLALDQPLGDGSA